MSNTDAVQTAVANKVNQLYGDTVFAASSKAVADGTQSDLQAGFTAQSVSASGNGHAAAVPDANRDDGGRARESAPPQLSVNPAQPDIPSGAVYNWVARVRVKKYELGTSFSVLFFLGKPADIPEDAASWRSSPAYVGGHHVFVNTAATHCENCRRQSELVVEGYVHLDRGIARDASSLGSFEPRVIAPYLKENLQWRVQKVSSRDQSSELCVY